MKPEQAQHQLDSLRKDRSLPKRDLSLGFLEAQFKREVAGPYKQLGDLAALWSELLPDHLVTRSKLVGLSRGTLHIEVDSPAVHYEIDQCLRGGAQRLLVERHRGPAIRKVQVRVGTRQPAVADHPLRQPPPGDCNAHLSPERQPPRGRPQKSDRGSGRGSG